MKMTKAERIFEESFTEARLHIKRWGYEENSCLNRLCYGDNETICTRTINAIKKLIATERKSLEISHKLGTITPERENLLNHALDMVELTANKEMRGLKEEVIGIAEETEPAQEAEAVEEIEEAEEAENEEAKKAEEAESADEEDELVTAIKNVMVETGRMSNESRLDDIEIVQDGDWARVGCYLYHSARTRKPYMYWNICVYVPEKQIHWDATTWYYI